MDGMGALIYSSKLCKQFEIISSFVRGDKFQGDLNLVKDATKNSRYSTFDKREFTVYRNSSWVFQMTSTPLVQ